MYVRGCAVDQWCDDLDPVCCTDDGLSDRSCVGIDVDTNDNCFCDPLCARYGDCCPDRERVCTGWLVGSVIRAANLLRDKRARQRSRVDVVTTAFQNYFQSYVLFV